MIKKLFYIIIINIMLVIPASAVFAENITSIINAPTAFVNGFGGIDINFETYVYDINQGTGSYNDGGITANLSYGFTDMLNVGISVDVGDVNKTGLLKGPIDMRQPKLFAKMQLLTGTFSLAAGYDAQGYRIYDSVTHSYEVTEKGYYAVVSKKNEVQTSNSVINITGGLNIPDFENLKLNGFFGIVIVLNEKLSMYAEYWGPSSDFFSVNGNFSIAAHIPVAPESFGIDIGVKNIGKVNLSEFYIRCHLVKTM
jgi:hypothetical protein